MSVRLKIEDSREGLVATISQRDGAGKVIGRPSVQFVATKDEARQQAKTLARSLGLKVYGVVDKTASLGDPQEPRDTAAEMATPEADHIPPEEAAPPWLVPGAGKSL